MSVSSPTPRLADLDFQVLKSLGTGAGSAILLIMDQMSGAKYALKKVLRQSDEDDVFINQAKHEFDVAMRLNHRSIIKIHDCAVRRGWFKTTGVDLLMEYVDGQTLESFGESLEANYEDHEPETKNRRVIRRLVAVFNNVAAAMAHMHRRGVYHGDLKPSNIMTVRSTGVKVIDFGTAWLKDQPKGRIQGTPQYMAPEQAADKSVNERTDVYNFGATMYRTFTGEFANLALPRPDMGMAYRNKRRPRDYDALIPKDLDRLIVACIEHEPERRPANMHMVQEKLQRIAAGLGIKATGN